MSVFRIRINPGFWRPKINKKCTVQLKKKLDICLIKNFNFDPAFWKCEGAQAKIVVYYPRNEVKILW